MKKLLFYLLAATVTFSACHEKASRDEDNDQDEMQESTSNGKSTVKTTFAQIENLPVGIDTIFGKPPAKNGGFYKFTFPRTDLKVTVDGIAIDPRLAFTTWFAFMPEQNGSEAMLMGDMVLLEAELPAVEKKLLGEGIEITAIHNHLLNEKPKVMYLHVGGTGNPIELAQKLKEALILTQTPLKSSFKGTTPDFDWGHVEQIMGQKGKTAGPVLKFGFPRKEKISEYNMPLPPGMGIATGIGFQQVGDKAAITGDFVLMENEVKPVMETLFQHNIGITALHNHMVMDTPHLFMMHFWAVGNPEDLAKGLKAALDKTNSKM